VSEETERPGGDEELVERARSAPEGDLRAFESLMERHQERVLANCRYLTRSADDAEDLAQEVFVKAYFALARFEGRSSFRTWLQRIKVNHCLNFLKKGQGRSFVDVESPEMQASPELSVAPAAERHVRARGQRERIAEVLDRMSATLRVPLILRDLDGLSYAEIAEDLGLGLSAVKMRIKRAREEFRRLYEGEGEEELP
jgi:RNA polymerase sigma-70 factor (ECF subfamily)